MLVNLRNYRKFFASDVIEYFDAYEKPVVITDLNLKVTAKNKALKNSGLKLRNGSGFLRFVHEAHVEGLKALAVSQVYNLTLSAGEFNSAAVFRGIDCMAFVLSRDIRHPAESVIEKYSKMSGYDLDINTAQGKRVQGMETVLKSMLDTRADFYPLPFFDCKKTAEKLIYRFAELQPRKAKRLKTDIWANEMICEGSERDFILAAAFFIALGADSTAEGEIAFKIFPEGNGLALTVAFEKDQGAVILHGAKGMAKGETEESDYWLYIVKLISDGNLWELTVSDDEKRFSAHLYMPAVKRGEEFFIRESALLGFAEILEYFFG